MANNAEAVLAKKGIDLVTPAPMLGNYVHAVRTGNLLYLSGKGPIKPEGGLMTGKVGRDLTLEEGIVAARLCAIAHLAVLKAELGSLDRVKRIVKVLGMVNCTDEFIEQSKVMNGYSDCMAEVFGEAGKHARSAVGMNSLPQNFAVEVEVIVEVE